MMIKPLAQRLAEYAVSLRFEELAGSVVHEVKRRVLDSIGCAMGAWRDEPGEVARRVALRLSAQPGSTLLGLKHKAPPDWAAFANGCLVRYLDYNDTYLSKEPAHPSDNIPAALAVAEAEGAGGEELITAIVIAYEAQCRMCDARSLRAIGWDHVTYGAFSSALAAARLMKLDVERMRHALGIAGVASAALRQTRVGELSHWKGCAFANAARHGVYAAMLAAEGMTGPAPIFEGDKGFEKLVSQGPLEMGGPFAHGAEESGDGRGERCMILNTSIKCWPVEYHAQSAVEAALAVRDELGVDASHIQEILVESHDAAVDIIGSEKEKWFPTTRETADHSLPYIVAAALADGEVTLKQFSPERIADTDLLALVQKVKVERHRELSELYPAGVGNIVSARTRDGRVISKRIDYPCGHARNKMSDAAVEEKFHRLSDPLLGRSMADAVKGAVWRLEEMKNMSELLSLIQVKQGGR